MSRNILFNDFDDNDFPKTDYKGIILHYYCYIILVQKIQVQIFVHNETQES